MSADVAKAIRAGKEITVKNTDLVVFDQYNQQLTKEQLEKLTFTATVDKADEKTLTATVTEGKTATISALKDAAAKTGKVTFTLTGKADSAFAQTFSVVKDADFTGYTVADLATVQVTGGEGSYVVAPTAKSDSTVTAKDASNNTVTLVKDTDYTVSGLEADKVKALKFAEGSDIAKLTATVTINATGEQFTKEVTFSKEASKVQSVKFVKNETAATENSEAISEVTIEAPTVDSAALLAAADVESIDQFSNKASVTDFSNVTFTKVSGDATFAKNGLADATATVEAGKTAVVKATVTVGGKTTSINVTIKAPAAPAAQ